MITVLIVDDQALVREGLAALLTGREGFGLVGVASDAAEAMELIERERPAVVLTDIRMPEVSGIELLGEIRRRHPGVRVIMLTTFHDDETVAGAVSSGADGFLLKDATLAELTDAIRRVAAGERVFRFGWGERATEAGPGAGAGRGLPAARGMPDLTPRESEVLQLLASGMSNAQIAAALGLAHGTVRNVVSVVLSKLGADSRTRAVLRARELGCI